MKSQKATNMAYTVPGTLNTQDNKVQLTRAFADLCQLHQLRRPGDVILPRSHWEFLHRRW